MKGRDQVAVAVLRSALGAIDNAEAVDHRQAPKAQTGRIAGAVAGLGAAEVARLELSEAEMAAIVRAEADDRRAAAEEYDRLGRHDESARLRAEAVVLDQVTPAES